MPKLTKNIRGFVIALAFSGFLLLILNLIVRENASFKQAEIVLSNNDELSSNLGKSYRSEFVFLRGFEFTGSSASYAFNVISKTKQASVRVELAKVNQNWTLTHLYIESVKEVSDTKKVQ